MAFSPTMDILRLPNFTDGCHFGLDCSVSWIILEMAKSDLCFSKARAF